jgi:hypothetical protein
VKLFIVAVVVLGGCSSSSPSPTTLDGGLADTASPFDQAVSVDSGSSVDQAITPVTGNPGDLATSDQSATPDMQAAVDLAIAIDIATSANLDMPNSNDFDMNSNTDLRQPGDLAGDAGATSSLSLVGSIVTLDQRKTVGTLVIHDDGLETIGRSCASTLCVTGGISP